MTALKVRAFREQDTRVWIVGVQGSLRTPVTSELRQAVEAIGHRGGRRVLLDLAELRDVDAAGVGELVCAFNVMTAAGGVLQIAHANRHVRRVLEIVGLFGLLTAGTDGARGITTNAAGQR